VAQESVQISLNELSRRDAELHDCRDCAANRPRGSGVGAADPRAAVGLIVPLGGGWTIEKLPSEQRLDSSSIVH
jgi:hypothetical protein